MPMAEPTHAVLPRPHTAESRPAAVIAPPEGVAEPAVWPIEPGLTLLNHGSYGVCPEYVVRRQAELRARMNADAPRFFKVELERLADRARASLAAFVNCPARDLALVHNGTFAVSTILRAIPFRPGDEIVITDHEYAATTNELARVCEQTGAVLRTARVPLPLAEPGVVTRAVAGAMSERTRLVLVSHVASAAGLVFPAQEICDLANERGVDVLIDGAHAPGQLPIDIAALRPTYYAASCHKWLNTPKGSGFLYVRPDRQAMVQPLALSCRVHEKREDRAAFLCDFDYVGTGDYTANLVIPDAIDHLAAQVPGGWPEIYERNRRLVAEGARLVRDRCGLEPAGPPEMFASMQGVLMPPLPAGAPEPRRYDDPLWDRLRGEHAIQVPVWPFSPARARIMRLSANLHNSIEQFERLAGVLHAELARERAA